jgi:hypothetical protein
MARFNYLERVRVLSQDLSSAAWLFGSVLPSLRVVDMDCTGVTDFSNMFRNGPQYSALSVNLTNTNSGTNFEFMFNNCRSLQSVTLDTSSGTNFEFMFQDCVSLQFITLDTSSGTNFSSMLQNCVSLQSVTLDTSSGTNFNSMFRDCRSLESVTLDTSNGTIFSSMFHGCRSLQSVTLDTGGGTDFDYMFYGCRSLQATPDLNFTSLEFANYMLEDCHSLAAVDLPWRFEEDVTGEYAYDGIFNSCYLSYVSLNQIYTDLPDATGAAYSPVFGVSSNYGVDDPLHDPTIATAKNWTIVY